MIFRKQGDHRMKRALLVLLALASVSLAHAETETYRFEIRGGTGTGFGGVGGVGGGVDIQSGSGDTETLWSLSGGIGFFLPSPLVEIGFMPSYTSLHSDGATISILNMVAGPIFNFM